MTATQVKERPWAKRAKDLEEHEGAWADYVAWSEWIDRFIDAQHKDLPDFLDALDQADTLLKVALYTCCCSLADGDAIQNKETP